MFVGDGAAQPLVSLESAGRAEWAFEVPCFDMGLGDTDSERADVSDSASLCEGNLGDSSVDDCDIHPNDENVVTVVVKTLARTYCWHYIATRDVSMGRSGILRCGNPSLRAASVGVLLQKRLIHLHRILEDSLLPNMNRTVLNLFGQCN